MAGTECPLCALAVNDAVLVARTLDTAPPDVIVAQALSSKEETLARPLQAQPPADYAIVIRHCNTIDEAQISLRRSSLNIKYGPNGIGKSTISRALELNSQGGDALQELLPFKFRQGAERTSPSVTGADDIERVLVFDDTYVSQFVFQADEVVKDSFEIFINTPEYREGIAQIESIFERLKDLFVENSVLDDVIASFTALRDAFTVTKSGAISKTSRGFKALGMSGKLITIPEPLRGYEKFLHSDIQRDGSRGSRRARHT